MFSEISIKTEENGIFSVVENTTTLSGNIVRTRTIAIFQAEGPVYRLMGDDRIPVINIKEDSNEPKKDG